MRGHDEIIEARKRGLKPSAIYVELRDYPAGVPQWAVPELNVYVEAGDTIERLDLFFVNRCFVMVSGSDPRRVRTLFDALQEHGALRVIAHVTQPLPRGTFDLVEIMDTHGVLTWHQSEENTRAQLPA